MWISRRYNVVLFISSVFVYELSWKASVILSRRFSREKKHAISYLGKGQLSTEAHIFIICQTQYTQARRKSTTKMRGRTSAMYFLLLPFSISPCVFHMFMGYVGDRVLFILVEKWCYLLAPEYRCPGPRYEDPVSQMRLREPDWPLTFLTRR